MFQHYLVKKSLSVFSYSVCSPGTERQATKREGPNNTGTSGWCCGDFLPKSHCCVPLKLLIHIDTEFWWTVHRVCSHLFLTSILGDQITSGQL